MTDGRKKGFDFPLIGHLLFVAHTYNMNKTKALFCWSGGKDSSLALYWILQSGDWDVRYLLCTLNGVHHRVSMHGVRETLVDAQATSIGIPLVKVFTYEANNAEYEQQMEVALLQAKSEGIEHVIFGDIFLEDLRVYRENSLAKIGMTAVFPLWKKNTSKIVYEFLGLGFKTITCCVNDALLGEEHVGVLVEEAFLNSLPPTVDPCGENGEFHTFCFDGPLFKEPIQFSKGAKVYKPLVLKEGDCTISNAETQTKGFWYCELT